MGFALPQVVEQGTPAHKFLVNAASADTACDLERFFGNMCRVDDIVLGNTCLLKNIDIGFLNSISP